MDSPANEEMQTFRARRQDFHAMRLLWLNCEAAPKTSTGSGVVEAGRGMTQAGLLTEGREETRVSSPGLSDGHR